MRRPKGFGKNYFSLTAICAYSSAQNLTSQTTALTQCSRNFGTVFTEEEEELLDELECDPGTILQTPSSSHCNCHFKRKLYQLAQRFKYQTQTFFIYLKTRSGIAPPF